MLKKGDPVRVRLHNGEVVEAVYVKKSIVAKNHLVNFIEDGHMLTTIGSVNGSRFVGPACVLVPIGENK